MKLKFQAEFLPIPIIILGAALLLYGILGLFTNQQYLVNFLVLAIGLLFVSTHQGLTVDTKNNEVSDYYWVFGLKLNNYKQSYDRLEAIVLSQKNFTQGYGFVPRLHASGILYQGYLKIKDRDPVYLGQSKNKKSLHKKLASIANKLGISIKDMTTEE